MPDEYLPVGGEYSQQTASLVYNPNRILYQFAEKTASEINGRYADVEGFLNADPFGAETRDKLTTWVEGNGIEIDRESLEQDWALISNLIARDVAGLLLDRQAYYRVWLEKDSQVQAALLLFPRAQELIVER